MQRRSIISGFAGFALCMAGVVAIDTAAFLTNSPKPSSAAVTLPLKPLGVDPSWVKSGSPQFKAIETGRSPDGRSMTGLWSCTGPTTFTWQFGTDETVTLLEGEVKVEYLGKRFTLRPGATATFHANTESTWTIDRYAKKVYTLYDPAPVGKAIRWLAPARG